MLNLNGFTTESRNPDTMNLDEMSAFEIVQAMNAEDKKVPEAIEAPAIDSRFDTSP